MKKPFRFYLSIFLVLTAFGSFACSGQKTAVETRKEPIDKPASRERNAFLRRLNDPRSANIFAAATWTLTHDYSDLKRSQEVLKTVLEYIKAFEKQEKGDSADADRLGGIKGLTDKAAGWLADDDQATRAFAAVVLGISGDRSYAPPLAALLNDRKYKERDLIQYDRGRAALALGMIGAQEYKSKLAALLESRNSYDRAGGAIGLGYLKAKEHVEAIKKLLKDEDEETRETARAAIEMIEGGESKINVNK